MIMTVNKSLNQGVSVTRDGLANEIQHVKQQEIMTDSNISQSRHVEVERELGRWVPDDDDRECPELDNIFDGPWNRLVMHIAIFCECYCGVAQVYDKKPKSTIHV